MMIMKQPPFPGMYRTKHFVDLHLLKIRYKDIVGNDVISIEDFIKYLKEIAKERSENDSAQVPCLESDLFTMNRSLLIPFSTDRTVDGAISQNGRLVTNSIGAILLPTQAFLQCLKSISKRKAEPGDDRNQEKVVNLRNGQFDCQSLRQSVIHHSWLSELRRPTDSRLGPAVRNKMAMEYEEFYDDFTWEEMKSFFPNNELPLTPRIGLVC